MQQASPTDRELRERCLELAVRAKPQSAIKLAGQFYAFIIGKPAPPSV